jgi:hypothetical protein
LLRIGGFSLACLVIGASVARAETYHVAVSGDDANPGTEALPWRTIAKANAAALKPGDRVLLRKGDVWREQLTVRRSGTAGNPIVFGAYGSGANPRIERMDPYSAWWEHSLVPDGSFELMSGGRPNDTWPDHRVSVVDSNGGGSFVKADPTTAVSGTHSVKLVNDGDGRLASRDRAQITTRVDGLRGDTDYFFRVSGRVGASAPLLLAVRIRDVAHDRSLDTAGTWRPGGAALALVWDADATGAWIQIGRAHV